MTKNEIRARARSYRRALSETEYRNRSQRIRSVLGTLDSLSSASVLHAYWPLVDRREIDLRPLLRTHLYEGGQLVLPIMSRSAGDEPMLEHRLLAQPSELEALEPNEWGVLEPTTGRSVDPEEADLILVPALAASPDGHRVGYGAGYYDRFLRDLDHAVPTICAVYSACVTRKIPADAHDVRVDALVTEQRVRRTATRGSRTS